MPHKIFTYECPLTGALISLVPGDYPPSSENPREMNNPAIMVYRGTDNPFILTFKMLEEFGELLSDPQNMPEWDENINKALDSLALSKEEYEEMIRSWEYKLESIDFLGEEDTQNEK